MEQDQIARLKAKYATRPPLFSPTDYPTIEANTAATFFVLCDDYSSKGIWVHPVGVHFVNKKQVVCSEIADSGPCFICEKIRAMEKQGIPESKIFRIRGPRKYAMNILLRGEQNPRAFVAPRTVAEVSSRPGKRRSTTKMSTSLSHCHQRLLPLPVLEGRDDPVRR